VLFLISSLFFRFADASEEPTGEVTVFLRPRAVVFIGTKNIGLLSNKRKKTCTRTKRDLYDVKERRMRANPL
jgi:hypothetical protein